jgi:hypothetical protein
MVLTANNRRLIDDKKALEEETGLSFVRVLCNLDDERVYGFVPKDQYENGQLEVDLYRVFVWCYEIDAAPLSKIRLC